MTLRTFMVLASSYAFTLNVLIKISRKDDLYHEYI